MRLYGNLGKRQIKTSIVYGVQPGLETGVPPERD